MRIAAAEVIWHHRLLYQPSANLMRDALYVTSKASSSKIFKKIRQTHLMDAVPLTFGPGNLRLFFTSSIRTSKRIQPQPLPDLYELAIGGTAVGTRLNTHPEFADRIAAIAELTGLPFVTAPNKFAALAAHDALVFTSGALRTLAVSPMKIATTCAGGLRAARGLGELQLPENEPGSSIMPGKVNPTQSEAMTMVGIQVIGNDVAVTTAGSRATSSSTSSSRSSPTTCCNRSRLSPMPAAPSGILRRRAQPDYEQIDQHLQNSLMLVTALSPRISFDNAAKAAKKAHKEGKKLRDP